MELEAIADEENGWVRFDPTVAAPVVAEEANALDTKRRRKPVVEEAVP